MQALDLMAKLQRLVSKHGNLEMAFCEEFEGEVFLINKDLECGLLELGEDYSEKVFAIADKDTWTKCPDPQPTLKLVK